MAPEKTLYSFLKDDDLVILLNQGDREAYTEIYNRFFGLLFTYAYKKLQNEDEVKDILQDVFIAIWHRHHTLVLNSSLAVYLYRAVRNRVLNIFAHRQVRDKFEQVAIYAQQTDKYGADYLIREKDIQELINAEILNLPPKMREIFLLSRNEHLTYQQIALTLGISESTVNTQMKRALKVLRKRLNGAVPFFIFFYL